MNEDYTQALKDTRIVWIDVESNGLYPSAGARLLEVAGIVTDGNLEEVGEYFHSTLQFTSEEANRLRAEAIPFVQEMHDATDLWSRLPEGNPARQVQHEMLNWLAECGIEPQTARLGGNSITLDRNFLGAELPEVLEYLHYRSLDMSSISGFFHLYRPEVPSMEKKSTHAALDDIRESIAEARYWRSHLGGL